MVDNELQEISDIWSNKFPNISISLWSNDDKTMYFGKIMTKETCFDWEAGSIGLLISLGEDFLRGIKICNQD